MCNGAEKRDGRRWGFWCSDFEIGTSGNPDIDFVLTGNEGCEVHLGHYLGPVVLRHEYEDADVLKVLARLASRRKETQRSQ